MSQCRRRSGAARDAGVSLNALVCLPFALLLRTVGGLSRGVVLVVAAAVTAMVPFNFWNNTFTWTKELTAAFILPGIHEYLVAYREGNRNGMAMSLAYLAPGFLCHYLTLPYAAMPGLHLVLTVPIRALPCAGSGGIDIKEPRTSWHSRDWP
jgi:hypothetical protein